MALATREVIRMSHNSAVRPSAPAASRRRRAAARLGMSSLAAATIAGTAFTCLPAAQADHDGHGTGRIHGIVLETGRIIAPGIDVSLYKADGEFVHATVTDSSEGAFAFEGLEPGAYVLWYENQNQAVTEWWQNQPDQASATPIQLSEGQSFQADAYLTDVSENLVPPTITGTATVGSTLTASRGQWFPTVNVNFSYQWLRGNQPISGATAETYKVTAADAGQTISVRVIAEVQGGTESATSLPTATVPGGQPPVTAVVGTAAPTISGPKVEGSVLTATTGAWTPSDVTVSYQWLRGGQPITGATGPAYTTTSADVGQSLTVRTTASKAGLAAATQASAAHGPITAAPVVVTPPTSVTAPKVSGTARVGGTLSASTGAWGGSQGTYGYQWTKGGKPIAGATGPKLKLAPAHAGASIAVVVTATNAAGTTSKASSAVKVAKAPTTLTVKATGGAKQVKVAVKTAGAGKRSGKVKVTVKVGKKTVVKNTTLVAGARTLTVKGLPRGTAKVTVAYLGDSSSAAATKKVTTKVR
ncbi:hypothetical protein L615_003100000290 [Nocardioides sp. J9]|nr:hypothetical protein L615_003100000290 [Nocardioides sp. J9]